MAKTPARPQQGSTPAPAPAQQEATLPPTAQQGQTPIYKDWASI